MLLLIGRRGTTANTALRCGTWVIVPGTKYRIVTDKIVDGRAHGNVLEGGVLAPNETDFITLWRRAPTDGAEWEAVEELDSDGWGHWTSTSLPELWGYVEGVGLRWQYGIGLNADAVEAIGPNGYAYTREYIAAVLKIRSIDLDHLRDSEGSMQVYYTNLSGQMIRRRYWGDDSVAAETVLWPAQLDDHSPSIMQIPGQLILVFGRGADVYAANSHDNGRTWEVPNLAIADRDVPVAELSAHRGIICVMVHDGASYCRRILYWVQIDSVGTWINLGGDSAEKVIVAAQDSRGSLRQEVDDSFTFFYVDPTDAVQYVQGKLDAANTEDWD